jgi:peptide/nickel transport system substrate-binding protein
VSRDETTRRVDAIRARSSELENHLIDEYSAGRISRREFVRRGSVIGMSIPLVGFLASACGTGKKTGTSGGGGGGNAVQAGGKEVQVRSGGTLKLGMSPGPSTEIDPLKVADEGGLGIMSQTAEFLAFSDDKLKLQPRLAESWKPSEDGSVWTFKIRQGVKFHDGTPMTARDVAASINALSDPKNGSNALSTFDGVLSKGSAKAIDDSTVRFELDAPNGNFPYLVSSDNYNAIVVPNDVSPSKWEKTFPGTGPWKLERFTPNSGVSYVKNADYWDKSRIPKLDRQQVKFYPKEQAQILGLQSGDVDVLIHFSPTGGKALLNDPRISVIELRSSVHREVHMRNDKPPFDDKRVRQAMALAVDRQALVSGLFAGKADLGNDSPFAPVFPSTDKSVAQRKQDLAKAKALLQQANPSTTSVTLNTWDGFELPDLAQLLQNDAAKIGLRLRPNVTPAGTYYGDAVFGKSPWLDSVMGITDYGHRGVPNVFLNAPLQSKGVWNAAHFKNKTYDGLVKEYTQALDIGSQRAAAKKIQLLLLDETPIVYPYFYYFLTGTKKNVGNVEVSAMGHYDITRAGFTSGA